MPRELIHRKKLFGGRHTAQEVHAKFAFPPDAKCGGCGRSGGLQCRAIVYYPIDELVKRDPIIGALLRTPEGIAKFQPLLLRTKYGPVMRMSTMYSCPTCRPNLEKALAKGPSWAIVDLNTGPGPDKVVVGVG